MQSAAGSAPPDAAVADPSAGAVAPQEDEPLHDNPRYVKVQSLNSGTFGFVQLARDTLTNTNVRLVSGVIVGRSGRHAETGVSRSVPSVHRGFPPGVADKQFVGGWANGEGGAAPRVEGTTGWCNASPQPHTRTHTHCPRCPQVAIKFLERGPSISKGEG